MDILAFCNARHFSLNVVVKRPQGRPRLTERAITASPKVTV